MSDQSLSSKNQMMHHATLVDRMARHVGVDLEAEVLSGAVPSMELADMVLRCSGCRAPGACSRMLDASDGGAEAPPSYCENVDVFADLKKA